MGKKRLIHFLICLINTGLFTNSIFAQSVENETRFQINGSLRTRGFFQSRDILLERTTSTKPVYNYAAEEAARQDRIQKQLNDKVQAMLVNKPDPNTPEKEALNYFDARMLLNLVFTSSKYFEAVAGLQIGNIYYGGQPYNNSANKTGDSSGGELGSASGVNLSTNLLYLNYKYPNNWFNFKLGIQLFSSPKGRVLFSTGAGVILHRKFQLLTSRLEAGALRSRERGFNDQDKNGYTDKYNLNENIFYLDYQFKLFKKLTSNLYSWYLDDSDKSNFEYGKLYWSGFYNEASFNRVTFVIHGVVNQGTVYTFNPKIDDQGKYLYDSYDRHSIKGGLYDAEIDLKATEKITLKLIGVGTTGRPGYEKDGVAGNSRGNGYRTLKPGFAVSNIGLDFTGGYALFNAGNMSGLYNYGSALDMIPFGSFLLTVGYFELRSSLSPVIDNNREYTAKNGYSTSNFFGKEYNLNFRWNLTEDFQIMFRSGYFIAGDGLKAYLDTRKGQTIKEAFISLDHKF